MSTELNATSIEEVKLAIEQGYVYVAYKCTNGAKYAEAFSTEREMIESCMGCTLTDEEWARYERNGSEWHELQNWMLSTLAVELAMLND